MFPRGTKLLVVVLVLVFSLVGAIATAALRRGEEGAPNSELRYIQSAVTSMMADNNITSLPHPVTVPTTDMGRFPDAVTPSEQKGLEAGDKPGYLLYGHDKTHDGKAEPTVDYLAFSKTRWAYTVASDGTVTQWLEATE